ncbi:MAG: hypothetical protein VW338_04065 [Rhodospirillaceae bacterium]
MRILDFIRRHKVKIRGIVITAMVPVVFLGALFLAARNGPDVDDLRAAAIALDNFYSDNPPNGVWEYQGVRVVDDKRIVVDDKRIVVDVHVAVVPHATVIESRNNRIRLSYMKLAYPTGDPVVAKWITETKVWINLHFHGKTLIEAAYPKPTEDKLFSS